MLKVKSFVFSPLQENTYLLYNEQGDTAIIDPGCYVENERKILVDFIKKNELKPVILLNTHGHLDHIFGNAFVQQYYNLVPHIHPLENPILNLAEASGIKWGLPFTPYAGDYAYIQHNQIINIGQDSLKVIFTPGHSPGSVSFYAEKQQFIVSGDVLFRESIGRTDLYLGNYNQLIQTITQEFYSLDEETTVYSGHGMPTTIKHEKVYNPFVQG